MASNFNAPRAAIKIMFIKTMKTQWAIAQELGWAPGKIARLATGRSPEPSQEDFEALAPILKASPEEIRSAYRLAAGRVQDGQ